MAASIRVKLYSSPSCSLCEPVKQFLHRHLPGPLNSSSNAYPGLSAAAAATAAAPTVTFEVVDISERCNTAAFHRWKHDIPVVTVNDREIARHSLSDPALLHNALQTAHLLSPLPLTDSVTLRNRIVMGSMHTGMEDKVTRAFVALV